LNSHNHPQKVIPPSEVVRERFDSEIRAAIEEEITERIFEEADIPAQVDAFIEANQEQLNLVGEALILRIADSLGEDPVKHWSDVAKFTASDFVNDAA